ncbi:MAG: bifunctional 4-hydroxy-2-oxoglutarate aldolase/2-dehydro-3-deoxy-phosphogluconate aldolase [Candidatus Gastranaerophilales bacterium]|nr:bifunctional 4-hydroxy-2-oxoglutarate aldolase/2-dehydro-3-deoxy-phosphogluconate aldolase [Candidatus Gastranaerophilales bacterium]
MQENLIKKISEEKIYPIIRSSDAQSAIDTANALIEGGIKILEINIENNSLYQAIHEVSRSAVVSAGGIITGQQALKALDAGAEIISSPIFQMNMVKISKDKEIPLIACASTANEAYNAWKTRVPLIKIFPAKALGGLLYIEDLLRPMSFLNIMPSGNISLDEVPAYIKAGAAAVGVGRSFYENSSYAEITQKAKKVIKILKDL